MTRAGEVVKTITDPSDRLREVRIIRNSDGSFGFEEWYFSDYPHEQCWIPARQPIRTITDSVDAAEREARARVDWLRGAPANQPE